MKAKTNHVWRLVSRPKGLLKESDFKWSSETISDLGDGEILIRHIYLSLEPASRHFAREEETFVPPVELGEVMLGIGIGVVGSLVGQIGKIKGCRVVGIAGILISPMFDDLFRWDLG